MTNLELEKVNEVVNSAVERLKEIGVENLEGLLVATNDEDKIVTDMCGTARSIEEMLVSIVCGLCEYEAYEGLGKEIAAEVICSKIKVGVLEKLGEKNE